MEPSHIPSANPPVTPQPSSSATSLTLFKRPQEDRESPFPSKKAKKFPRGSRFKHPQASSSQSRMEELLERQVNLVEKQLQLLADQNELRKETNQHLKNLVEMLGDKSESS